VQREPRTSGVEREERIRETPSFYQEKLLRLAELIQSGGVAGGPMLPPAGDETQKGTRAGGAGGGDDMATPEGAST
jgi:hypothetical protein